MARLVVLVAISTVAILALVAVLVAGVWSNLTPDERDTLGPILEDQAGLAAASALLFAVLVGGGLAILLGRWATPARRLAADARLIATANPQHSVRRDGAGELRAVAAAVDELAGCYREARAESERAVRQGRAEVEEERNRLAALMTELSQAVLVCNADGLILLYNRTARDLLGGEDAGGAYVGLGRSVFAIFERDVIGQALDTLRQLAEHGQASPLTRFATPVSGRLLRVQMSPVRAAEGGLTGFVLLAEDVTTAAATSGRRDALVETLGEGSRGAVASIRAAAESLLEYGELGAQDRARFLEVIREEALGLSTRIDEALAGSAGPHAEPWTLDEMRGSDLMAAVQRACERAGGPAATLDDSATGADVWLAVDSQGLVRALAAVAGRLHSEHGVPEVALGLAAVGSHARLDLVWSGSPVGAETLRRWEQEPAAGADPTLEEVLVRHGAAAWSQDEDRGHALVRVLLPLAPTPASPPGPAPSALGAGGRADTVSYDFALLERIDRGSELDDRPLAELSYTVFDTETTGLDPLGGDELISIGAVRIVNGHLLTGETFEQLIDPRRGVSTESMRIHGITDEMLAGQPTIAEVLPRFARFAEDTVLVGHNVAFDMQFLDLKANETGIELRQPVLDTLLLAAAAHPEEQEHTLESMAARFGLTVIGRHTALGDALLTGEIFLRLLRMLAAQGIVRLEQARRAARQTYHARVSASLYERR